MRTLLKVFGVGAVVLALPFLWPFVVYAIGFVIAAFFLAYVAFLMWMGIV